MDIRIKATDYQMPQETADYLNERISHIEKLLGSDATLARCEVEIGRDAGRPRHGAHMYFAEVQVSYPGSSVIRATNRSESINGAIDDAKAELERQIRSNRKLHRRIIRQSGAWAKRILRME